MQRTGLKTLFRKNSKKSKNSSENYDGESKTDLGLIKIILSNNICNIIAYMIGWF
jgi:hypothetical protein